MDLKKINKFIKFLNHYSENGTKKIITVNQKFEPISQHCSYSKQIGSDQLVLSVDDSIYIVYTKKPSEKISCIFKTKPGYIQSHYYLFDMQNVLSQYIKFFCQYIYPAKNYLILGLGIGTFPNYIINNFGSSRQIERIDCVDVNQILTKLYKTFFSVSDLIHVYNEPALDFVSTTLIKYDIVLVDIPCEFVTYELMEYINSITTNPRNIYLNLIGKGIENIDPSILFDKFVIKNYYQSSFKNNVDLLKVNHLFVLE